MKFWNSLINHRWCKFGLRIIKFFFSILAVLFFFVFFDALVMAVMVIQSILNSRPAYKNSKSCNEESLKEIREGVFPSLNGVFP